MKTKSKKRTLTSSSGYLNIVYKISKEMLKN